MEKLLLIDGNSMLFRAYYATVYGQSMNSSSGIPTNAIYGFALMLQKAVKQLEPKYIVVAFDHGKDTYRHKEYAGYKANRAKTPDDLVIQFPIIREYLDACHIVHYEQEGLEADDIIGCLAKQNKEYDVNILTSDKDMLQLVDNDIKVLLMQKGITDFAVMDPEAIFERFQLKPLQIIDLKGLSGDPSDNIPGVRKIGDKTAIKLLNQYDTIENLYQHIDEISGKLQENLLLDKDVALMSKRLATIMTDKTINLDLQDCLYHPQGNDAYNFYMKYDIKTLAKKIDLVSQTVEQKDLVNYQKRVFKKLDKIKTTDLTEKTLFYLQHQFVSIVNEKIAYYLPVNDFLNNQDLLDFLASDKVKIFYNIKKWWHLAIENNFTIKGKNLDLMIIAFLCDSKLKSVEDVLNKYSLPLDSKKEQLDLFNLNDDDVAVTNEIADKLSYLSDTLYQQLQEKEMVDLYFNIELPLTEILADMEHTGIRVDEQVLDDIAQQTSSKLAVLEEKIYQLAGKNFNINSPKQLAEVIYDDLKLMKSTKRSTDAKVLSKLVDRHPIINEILEYRKYAKIYSTYAFGLKKYIAPDGKIHTDFNQCITETGRLSSSDPNLQNISIRNEEASLIRAAFIPEDNCVLVGADYSQVELRMLAHLSQEENLIEAFKASMDIHTKTAMDIFLVNKDEVTPLMRRQAKAINFGIDYGMSAFGLSERLQIPVNMANDFINSYFAKYPKVKIFMDNTIEQCIDKGYVTTMFNRRREIEEIRSNNHNLKEFGKRAAMNAPVQGSAADLIKIAMINVANKIKEKGYKSKLILQIHDELILNVPIEEKDAMMKLVQNEMENALQLSVPLQAQATCGSTWLEVK